MNSAATNSSAGDRFRVRPIVLLGCGSALAILLGPPLIAHWRGVQLCLLLIASLLFLWGWFALLKYRELSQTWRGWVAVAPAAYLLLSVPAFFYELYGLIWVMRHHWITFEEWFGRYYVIPWGHWGFVLIFCGVVSSFFGRGKSRVAFVLGGTLLMILWASIPPWIF